MAATKIDPVAAKQAKQKKLLIGLSVVLVAVLAIQLPRIMGGGSKPAAAAAGATGATGAVGVTPAPAATPVPVAPAKLTTGEVTAAAGQAQLASFSLFAAKDPFVPQIKDTSATAGAAAGAGAPTKPGAAPKPGTGGSGSGAGGAGGGAGGSGGGSGGGAQPAPSFVTLAINGETQTVEVKGIFPTEDPLFRLVAVSAKSVKIGIAGGKLTRGQAVTLRMGKKLTLINRATGARYVIQLLYVGASPERMATFTASEAPPAPQPTAAGSVSQTATAP